MDQVKIGKFIKEKRKELNVTNIDGENVDDIYMVLKRR